MSYSVRSFNNNHRIIERGSNLVVYTTGDGKTARSLCRSLNLGSGFGGTTPEFFAEFKQKERPTSKR